MESQLLQTAMDCLSKESNNDSFVKQTMNLVEKHSVFFNKKKAKNIKL